MQTGGGVSKFDDVLGTKLATVASPPPQVKFTHEAHETFGC